MSLQTTFSPDRHGTVRHNRRPLHTSPPLLHASYYALLPGFPVLLPSSLLVHHTTYTTQSNPILSHILSSKPLCTRFHPGFSYPCPTSTCCPLLVNRHVIPCLPHHPSPSFRCLQSPLFPSMLFPFPFPIPSSAIFSMSSLILCTRVLFRPASSHPIPSKVEPTSLWTLGKSLETSF